MHQCTLGAERGSVEPIPFVLASDTGGGRGFLKSGIPSSEVRSPAAGNT